MLRTQPTQKMGSLRQMLLPRAPHNSNEVPFQTLLGPTSGSSYKSPGIRQTKLTLVASLVQDFLNT